MKSSNAQLLHKVDNAIILTAEFDSSAIPLTYETPKSLLPVFGQPIIERQIEQLREAGIDEIIVIVGYMGESLDYLADKYDVKLVVDPDFYESSNVTSLFAAKDYFKNSYILASGNYFENNIFNEYEPFSWFSSLFLDENIPYCHFVSDEDDIISQLIIEGKEEFFFGGPVFLDNDFSQKFATILEEYPTAGISSNSFWKRALNKCFEAFNVHLCNQLDGAHDFNTLSQLRKFDKMYLDDTHCAIMEYISEVFGIPQSKIYKMKPFNTGLTNQSFIFEVNEENYVFRVPGAGTDKLVNRSDEKRAYDLMGNTGITDEIVAIDENTGIKITKYFEGARVSEPLSNSDLKMAMRMLKELHGKEHKVTNSFDIDSKIHYYHSLADEINSIRYPDIEELKRKVASLLELKSMLAVPEILCHGDYAYSNVLFLQDGSCKIIDWEYSGSSDPIMDVSMYCISSVFDRDRVEKAIRYYLDREPTRIELTRLYMYLSLAGFLWCMWAEYKQGLGEEFTDYSLRTYGYMNDYYAILSEEGYFSEIMEAIYEV